MTAPTSISELWDITWRSKVWWVSHHKKLMKVSNHIYSCFFSFLFFFSTSCPDLIYHRARIASSLAEPLDCVHFVSSWKISCFCVYVFLPFFKSKIFVFSFLVFNVCSHLKLYLTHFGWNMPSNDTVYLFHQLI